VLQNHYSVRVPDWTKWCTKENKKRWRATTKFIIRSQTL